MQKRVNSGDDQHVCIHVFSLTVVGNIEYKKYSTKYFSPAEKYRLKCFKHEFILISITLTSIRNKNDSSGNGHHLRYFMLFSNIIFQETPRTVRFCGLGGLGEKVVDVLGKATKACFACLLLILSYSKK